MGCVDERVDCLVAATHLRKIKKIRHLSARLTINGRSVCQALMESRSHASLQIRTELPLLPWLLNWRLYHQEIRVNQGKPYCLYLAKVVYEIRMKTECYQITDDNLNDSMAHTRCYWCLQFKIEQAVKICKTEEKSLTLLVTKSSITVWLLSVQQQSDISLRAASGKCQPWMLGESYI